MKLLFGSVCLRGNDRAGPGALRPIASPGDDVDVSFAEVSIVRRAVVLADESQPIDRGRSIVRIGIDAARLRPEELGDGAFETHEFEQVGGEPAWSTTASSIRGVYAQAVGRHCGTLQTETPPQVAAGGVTWVGRVSQSASTTVSASVVAIHTTIARWFIVTGGVSASRGAADA